jgi:hypothetical protein
MKSLKLNFLILAIPVSVTYTFILRRSVLLVELSGPKNGTSEGRYYDQTKKDEMGGACSTQPEIRKKNLIGKFEGNKPPGRPRCSGRMLKCFGDVGLRV